MRNSRVQALLFVTVLVMTALPLAAAFYFLDEALQTSLNLGFNPQVVKVLDIGSRNLKTLRDLDPRNKADYRAQFEEFESLKHVYSNPGMVRQSVLDSLKIYFGIGLLATVLLSVLFAVILSQKIAHAYKVTFDELTSHREKVRYLEEMASWQELAKVLAHEIKNPLTPIEVLITSLSRSYFQKSQPEFQEQLRQTEQMIGEELAHLKSTVNKFSEFAKLPRAQLVEENVADMLAHHVKAISAAFDAARLELTLPHQRESLRAKVDSTLLRQVLMNIVRNAVESSAGKGVRVTIIATYDDDAICIAISNDGEPVPVDIAARIFDPYVSSKSGKENMGLGLAIVKLIVIEHGGEIKYVEEQGHPTFVISLPRAGRSA